MGVALQTEGHLFALRRTRFGPFGIEQAVCLESWEPTDDTPLVSIREALSDLRIHCVTERVATSVRQGKTRILEEIGPAPEGSLLLLVDATQRAVAVITRRGGRWGFGRVLNERTTLQGTGPVLTTQG
jgi:tRNA pseudouridine55 synthase